MQIKISTYGMSVNVWSHLLTMTF